MKIVYIKRNDLFRNINLLLCNNITQADPNFVEDNNHVFYDDCEDCTGDNCEACKGSVTEFIEPYQYYLTSLSSLDEERFKEYGVTYGYSEALDLHVLPIYDFGTSWDAFSYSKEVEDNYTLWHNETLERTTVY